MRAWHKGLGGSLLPGQYLADRLIVDAGVDPAQADVTALWRRLRRWWRTVDETCGPATGIRAIFDVVAMPLSAALGFRAEDVTFTRSHAIVRLTTGQRTPVGLVAARWAHQMPAMLRDAIAAARQGGAAWCLVVAPPYVSIVDAGSGWARRSVDFCFPQVLDTPESVAVFWALARARAFDRGEGEPPPIGVLVAAGERFQDRVREDLQDGVHAALGALMRVLPQRPGAADASFGEALTLVYRVLFLLFVESRDLVPCRHPAYRGAYAISSLCRTAIERGAPPGPPGLWAGLAAISRLLRRGCLVEDLIVRPFNGRLFARASAPSLERRVPASVAHAVPRDAAVARVLLSLVTRESKGGRDVISYADLGVEQLGAVYERVLDVEPGEITAPPVAPVRRRRPAPRRHGPSRKQSGTFYTPRALTEFVVRRTLEPLVAKASADAILGLRVVDPSMGSGAFLVAACRYLTSAYEQALVNEGRLADHAIDEAGRADMRRVVARSCLYGVDRNPVAVQLAQLSLWLTTLARDKPLSFVDHRLRVGDSLIGATPDDLRHVVDAPRGGSRTLPLFDVELEHAAAHVAAPLLAMARQADDTLTDVRGKETAWARLCGEASPLAAWRAAADLWCARWFWPSGLPPSAKEVRAAIDALLKGDSTLRTGQLASLLTHARACARQHEFFHWPLAFPDAFYDERGQPRATPGFDAVIGNPPWEMLRADHGGDGGAGRLVRFIRDAGLYPSCDRGHVNLYQPFLERALTLTRAGGRVGLVLPWGLATDDGAASLRARLFDRSNTDLIVGFDNVHGLFPVHRGLRFMVVVTSPGAPTREMRTQCGVSTVAEIERLEPRREAGDTRPAMSLTPALLERVSGPSRRVPDVRRAVDLNLLADLTRRFPPIGSDEGWRARFGRELNATEDRDALGDRGLPVLEGKHIEPFRVTGAAPRRILASEAARRLPDRRFEHARLGYRDVSGVGNKLALIAAVIPPHYVTTHTLFCLRTPMDDERQHFLCAVFNSFVVNLLARMLMGGHLTTSLVEQLPAPMWQGNHEQRRIARLARRLSTAEPARHRPIGAALHAAVARLYGIDEGTFASVVEAFPLVPEEQRRAAVRAFHRSTVAGVSLEDDVSRVRKM